MIVSIMAFRRSQRVGFDSSLLGIFSKAKNEIPWRLAVMSLYLTDTPKIEHYHNY